MSLDGDAVLARLHGKGLKQFAQLVVDHALARPLDERLDPDLVLALIQDGARDWDDARLKACVAREWTRLQAGYAALGGTVRDHVPQDALRALDTQLRQPASLDPVLLSALVDQPAVRSMMQELLQTTLSNFMKRASSPVADNRLASAMASRARGFLKSGMTGAVLSAVGEGLGAEADRRVREFVDETVTAALQQVVLRICDPAQEGAYGALRAGILDSAVHQDVTRWVAQVDRLQPAERALALALATRDAVQTPAFAAFLRAQLGLLRTESPSLWALLEDAGLLAPARRVAAEVVALELKSLVASDAFRDFFSAQGGAPPPKAPRPRKTKG